MDFDLLDEQLALRDSAARFLRKQYSPEARRRIVTHDAGFSPVIWRSFAEFGWLGLSLPEAVGGWGLSFVDTTILAEQLGRALVVEPYVALAVLSAGLVAEANGAAHEVLLRGFSSGAVLLALAHSEPGASFEPTPLTVRARSTTDGYTLHGVKMLALGAGVAQWLVVSAQLDDTNGYALFLVPANAAGIVRDTYPLIDGSSAADVEFRQVKLSGTALLATAERGPALLERVADRATVALCAEAVGAIDSVVEITAAYLKTRRQFGQAIGTFQALQHRLAEMFVEAQHARSVVYHALAHLDGTEFERHLAVSSAKVVVAKAGRFVAAQGVQLHGGYGVSDEYEVGHYFKKLIVFEKLLGDIDYHTERFIAASDQSDLAER